MFTRKNLLTALLSILILSGGVSGTYAWQDSENLKYARSLSNAFVEVSNKVIPAVVSISTTKKVRASGRGEMDEWFYRFFDVPKDREFQRQGLGSGFIITDDGYVVTNNHVVENADEIIVNMSDNMQYEAEIVGTDPLTDIALIKIKGRNFPTLKIGDSDNIKIGEWVLAFGTPLRQELSSTVTAGIVSARGRNIGILGQGYTVEDFIQTDAAINPGNSGGPLVNLNGEVIGINSAIVSETGRYSGYGFSIPINLAMATVDDLKKHGKVIRGYLGITITDIQNQADMKKYKLDSPEGVRITGFQGKSPAREVGLKPEDVIIEVEGVPVNRVNQLQSLIASKDPGDKIRVKVMRNGKPKEFEVSLKGIDEIGDQTAGLGDAYRVPSLGMDVAELRDSESVKEMYGKDINGIQIIRVVRNSICAEAGMKAGDIIYKIGRYNIKGIEDFEKAIDRYKRGSRRVTFYIVNDRGTQLITLRIPE